MGTSGPVRLGSVLFLLAGIAIVSATAAPVPVSAKTKKQPQPTHLPSYAFFDNSGAARGSTVSACSKSGCANGIRFEWSASEGGPKNMANGGTVFRWDSDRVGQEQSPDIR
jgi:hypothetical protein